MSCSTACNPPAHRVIGLHVVLAVNRDVESPSVRCVSGRTSPPSWETQSVDRKRERLGWLIHIWFSYRTHTHAAHTHTRTSAHSSETRAPHKPLVVLAEYGILLVPGNG